MVSLPQQVFMVMTQKENLMKDRLARKTTQTDQQRKQIKEYREPSQSRVTKIAASLLFTKNVKALVQRLDAKHVQERLLQRYPKTSN